jgi:hypothetical protein
MVFINEIVWEGVRRSPVCCPGESWTTNGDEDLWGSHYNGDDVSVGVVGEYDRIVEEGEGAFGA